MTGFQTGSGPCTCGRAFHETQLVAVTGGPGAGKTAVLEMARRVLCSHVGFLPEAAGVVFGGGFPRQDGAMARRAAQRAIYHVQREMQRLVVEEGMVAIGLCDRGTVDGVAYWPDSAESYWAEFGTTPAAEYQRYAAVVHLRTPAADGGYNRDNALRVESASQAQEIDARILAAWEGHPCRLVVENDEDFEVKASRALALIRAQLPPCCRTHRLAPGP